MNGLPLDILFDLALCLLILGVAAAAVLGRDLFGAVVMFIVYGLLLAMAWLRLQAPDVALAEAAIGAGLTGVLLLGASSMLERRTDDFVEAVPPGRFAIRAVTALAALGVALALGYGFLSLPAPAGLQAEVAAALPDSGAENPVTAVLLNFRAWDTLLESIVLLAALLGVWMLAEERDWGGRPGARQHAVKGGVLAGFGRVLPPLGLLVGVYLVWAGSSQPGGAFQGGTVLAAVWLLVVMAGLSDSPLTGGRALRFGLVAGPLLFLAVGLAGLVPGGPEGRPADGGFLTLPPDLAATLILLVEAGLTASIALTLGLLVLGPPARDGQGGAVR